MRKKADVNGFFPQDQLQPIVVTLETAEGDSPSEDEFVLNLPHLPGADDVEVEEDEELSVEDEDVEDGEGPAREPKDQWDWQAKGTPHFLDWLRDIMTTHVPKHTGYDTTGLEKAISHFERVDKEITRAMRVDYNNEINSAHAEKARDEIEKGLERLVDRLEKVKSKKYKRHAKKKAWAEQAGFIKEAGTTKIVGITITAPLFISSLARTLINGMVSAGHDIEDMFHKQVDEYKLDKREQVELAQLLDDMGYAIRRDRGYPVGTKVDITNSDNFDWAANYYS